MQDQKTVKAIQKSLLDWYRREKRDLPWRRSGDPYSIWVSEIMLQQTQVKTVIPYYRRWLESFPTLKALAAASEEQVLKRWEGLGYYSRARNLRRAARIVEEQYGGQIPDRPEEIQRLPGIGRYTAGAILSIAFGKRVPVLDGNVKRALARIFRLEENGATAASQKRLWQAAERLLPEKNAGDFNQALMELGATLCLPRKPACLSCPLASVCRARAGNLQDRYPPPKSRAPAKKIEVSAAVIIKKDRVYIQQRLRDGLMGGLWEFPGGKREKGESMEECVRREIMEELGVEIAVEEKLMTVKHSYTQFRVALHVYLCRLLSGRIRAKSCEQWKWARFRDLDSHAFPAANAKIVRYLTNGFAGRRARPAGRPPGTPSHKEGK